jgi:hypothetical protein
MRATAAPRTRVWRAVLAALIPALLAGCAGVKTYPNTLEKNVSIRSETVSGSALFQVKTTLGVHRVDERCQLEFEGVVELDKPSMGLGVPTDRWNYLVFTFSGSSFLGGSNTSINRETLFRARPGHRYDIAVSYRKDIYHVTIRETPPRGATREVEFRDIRVCRPPWRVTRAANASGEDHRSRPK